jgi:hypothetical protein
VAVNVAYFVFSQQLSDEPGSLQDRGHFTSTESLEDIIDKEMRRKGRAVVQEAQV